MNKLILVLLIFSNICFAAGTIRLDGKVKSFSTDFIAIQSGENIYHVNKKHLSEAQRKRIKNIKIETSIVLDVNFDAVTKAISQNK